MNERQYGEGEQAGTGEATLDLTRRSPSPIPRASASESAAVAEAHIRSRSRHLIIGGSALTVMIFAAAIVWHVGFGSYVPAAYITPLYAASCGAILIGCLEYVTRHSRAQQALALQIALQTQADQLRLVGLMDEELQQRYYRGCGDTIRDMGTLRSTGTDPVIGRVPPLPRAGGDVVELRRRVPVERNDAHFS